MEILRKLPAPDLVVWLADAKKRSGLGVTELCRQADILPQTWYQIRGGRLKYIQEATLERIEAALGDRYPRPMEGKR